MPCLHKSSVTSLSGQMVYHIIIKAIMLKGASIIIWKETLILVVAVFFIAISIKKI
jgi:hypothetical protein